MDELPKPNLDLDLPPPAPRTPKPDVVIGQIKKWEELYGLEDWFKSSPLNIQFLIEYGRGITDEEARAITMRLNQTGNPHEVMDILNEFAHTIDLHILLRLEANTDIFDSKQWPYDYWIKLLDVSRLSDKSDSDILGI